MRKKGPIWGDYYQKLVVESYRKGMFITDIMGLPEIAELGPSEYTIRNILKANNVQPTWKRRKRKPEVWDDRIVEEIISLRNEGRSIRAIRDEINEAHGAKASKSTIVRILEEHEQHVDFSPTSRGDIWNPRTVARIIELYKDGVLITDIRRCDFLRPFKPSAHMIREILKRNGIQLTWRKGELRRWPDDMQRRIVELYRSGMRFSDILTFPDLRQFRPTNYSIRKILRNHGVRTKGETRHKQPVSDERFQLYIRGKLSGREEAIIHKHLATNKEGRERMIARMSLNASVGHDVSGHDAARLRTARANAERWAAFFSWGMCNLGNESMKKNLVVLGLRYGNCLKQLARAFGNDDESARKKAWKGVYETLEKMKKQYAGIIGAPAESFRLIDL